MIHEPINQNISKTIANLKSLIATCNFANNHELLKICKVNDFNLIASKGEQHRIHDILETAVNLYLFEKFAFSKKVDKYTILAELENFERRLPTQTWRDEEQITLQQFSTPPALGFIMAQLIRPTKNSKALEPSAGTGSLANWLKIAGCCLQVNEISARRRQLLEIQGYQPHAVDGELLDDLLDPEIKPDFILMNPPFSTSGGRTSRRNSNFGFRHVEAALRRLQPGGRLVTLLGADACLKTDKGKKFWHRVGGEYRVHAFLIVPREVFYKYGTTFQTVAVIVSKPEINDQPIQTKPQIVESGNLSEMLRFADDFAGSES